MNKTLLSATALVLFCSSCSMLSRHHEDANAANDESDSQKIERLQNENKQLSSTLATMSSKLSSMEAQLSSMNEKLDTTRTRVDNIVDNTRAKPGPVKSVPTEGAASLPPAGDNDAEAAFTSDQPIRKYRQAMILFQSHSYPEASLGFSSFVEQYPDHALAGSAQYYLGESYFKQGEYKLAARELSRVITTYDRSPHISDTLRDLAVSEEKIGQPEEAAKHRQLLTSLFPHSPAAHASVATNEVESGGSAEAPIKRMIRPRAKAGGASNPASEGDSTPVETTSTGENGVSPGQSTGSGNTLDAPPPTAPMAPNGSTGSEQ